MAGHQYRPQAEEASPQWLAGPELPEWDDPQDSYGNAALTENLLYGGNAPKDPLVENAGEVGNRTSSWADGLDTMMDALPDGTLPSWAKTVVKGLGLAGDATNQLADGRDGAETTSELVAKEGADLLADRLGFKDPADTIVNFVNDMAVGMGMPESVTNATGLGADITPSKLLENSLRFVGRGVTNVLAGDDDALARQGGDLLEGDYGTPLQGYGAAAELYLRLDESGSVQDVEDAIDAAGAHFDGGIVEDYYDYALGDGSHEGGRYVETPEDGTFEASSGNDTIDWVCRDLIGL